MTKDRHDMARSAQALIERDRLFIYFGIFAALCKLQRQKALPRNNQGRHASACVHLISAVLSGQRESSRGAAETCAGVISSIQGHDAALQVLLCVIVQCFTWHRSAACYRPVAVRSRQRHLGLPDLALPTRSIATQPWQLRLSSQQKQFQEQILPSCPSQGCAKPGNRDRGQLRPSKGT